MKKTVYQRVREVCLGLAFAFAVVLGCTAAGLYCMAERSTTETMYNTVTTYNMPHVGRCTWLYNTKDKGFTAFCWADCGGRPILGLHEDFRLWVNW